MIIKIRPAPRPHVTTVLRDWIIAQGWTPAAKGPWRMNDCAKFEITETLDAGQLATLEAAYVAEYDPRVTTS